MKQLTREWLNAAGDDLLTIENLQYNPILTNVIAFHSQQAIEKILKAIMEEYEISFKILRTSSACWPVIKSPRP